MIEALKNMMVGIKYFTAEEILMGKIVPLELLPNIIPTLKVLDYVREYINTSIHINSTYRNPEYNRLVGGKSSSLHLSFNAIDFTFKSNNGYALRDVYRIINNWDMEYSFKFLPSAGSMGLGLYERQYFIHIDTRKILNRPSPARWGK